MTNLNRNSRRCLAGLALLTALAGGPTACSTPSGQGDAKPAAAASQKPSPEPLPSQDWNRLACHTLPTGMLETLDNLADTRRAAEHAMKSGDQIMAQHGRDLRDAVNARETADLNGQRNAAVDANLDISRAALDMAEACATLYGDGQW